MNAVQRTSDGSVDAGLDQAETRHMRGWGRSTGIGTIAVVVASSLMSPAPAGATLADTWCGVQPAVGADSGRQLSNAPQIKVLYIVRSDRPNDFAAKADTLQRIVKHMVGWLASQSGGRKTLRVDLGTSCGSSYVDFGIVRVDPPPPILGNWTAANLVETLQQKGKASYPGYRNYLGFHIVKEEPNNGVIFGEGISSDDDSPHPANRGNVGGSAGVVAWIPDASDPYETAQLGMTSLHEVFHNLGAVQPGAPNASGAHCTDYNDLMCPAPGVSCAEQPPPVPFIVGAPVDCNKDDYFNPAPAPGSYLSSHWNVFNSLFLCRLSDCETAQQPPAIGLKVTGTTASGKAVLRASGGVAYHWNRGDGYEFGPKAPSGDEATAQSGQRVTVRGFAASGAWSEATVVAKPGGSAGRAAVTRLRILPRRFSAASSGPSARAAGRRPGARVSYRLTARASIRFTVERARPGRRAGRRCVTPGKSTRRRPRCTRFTALRGAFTRAGRSGTNRFRFAGRLRGRKLAPASYRLVATPRAKDRTGRAARTSFQVVR